MLSDTLQLAVDRRTPQGLNKRMENHLPSRILSGGQTGADRAALDVALELGIACGGWVPRGRQAEDGRIPERYPNLVEADSPVPDVRTELNVRDSDATLIISRSALMEGSAYTGARAEKQCRPYRHVDLSEMARGDAVEDIRTWLAKVRPDVLNVAGPRASGDAEIYELARAVLMDALLPRI